MSSIKFNYLTTEIEMEGSESFIESNFNKIQDLLVESFGAKKKMASRMTKANQEPKSGVIVKEYHACAEIKGHELKAKRAPLRKYIRKAGIPGHERMVVEVIEQKPKAISLESLREKFGLSETKIGGTIRDAEKLGKLRRVMNGSYAWT